MPYSVPLRTVAATGNVPMNIASGSELNEPILGVERVHTNREVLQCKGKLCPAGNGVDDRVSAGIVALACDRLQIAAAGGAAGLRGK